MWDLAGPSMIVKIGAILPQMILAAVVGKRLGSHHLDGFGVGNLVFNIF